MKRYFVTDIHGSYKGLMEVLQAANFNYEEDLLINGGDIVDGWGQIYECVDELLKIKNLINIMGNHDEWFIRFLEKKMLEPEMQTWLQHGGIATVKSYNGSVPETHYNLLKNAYRYYVLDNFMFTHGGYSLNVSVDRQNSELFCWDTSLLQHAYINRMSPRIDYVFDEVFLGHQPVNNFDSKYTKPTKFGNIWGVDTGGCFHGRLSMINIDTKEIFQSEYCEQLYPDEKGRNNKSYNDSLIK